VVVVNVAIFWDVAPSSSYVKRLFGGTYHRHLQGRSQPSRKQHTASEEAEKGTLRS
jgi:hypothetical protein